jgi:hypothetical protein
MGEAVSVAQHRCFSVPKRGNSREEYEDAVAADAATGRFAVADGASESIFAGEWANMLCEAFVAAPPSRETIGTWLAKLQKRWLAGVSKKAVPWYIEEKLQDGAFATFLGLIVDGDEKRAKRSWRAIAVGDSCLFHVRDDAMIVSFPMEKAAGFGTRPHLIGSRQSGSVDLTAAAGFLEPGDQLFLMTDALAEWFLTQHEKGRKPWQRLARLTQERFAELVDSLRDTKRLKNDDVTLLIFETDKANM